MSLPASRDLRLDTLRGLLLVCMALNHVPSDLHGLTDRPLGIFSAAEAFVFLSGLLAGVVYTRRLRERGPAALRTMTSRRATDIYGWHLAAYFTCLIVVQLTDRWAGFCAFTVPQLFHARPALAALLGAAMLHQPGWLDILPMYCALVLLLRWVLPALEAGRRDLVLLTSFAGWVIVQFAPPIEAAPLAPVHLGSFNLLAWQFLFVLGVAIGHARSAASRPRHPRRPSRSRAVRGLMLAVALAFTIYVWGLHHRQWPQPLPDALYGIVLNKPALGALRLADFLLVAWLVSLVGAAWPRALQWRPLAFLGRHSLPVVAVQSVVVLATMQFADLYRTPLARGCSNAALIATLFAAAWAAERWKKSRAAAPQIRPRLPDAPLPNQAYGIRPT